MDLEEKHSGWGDDSGILSIKEINLSESKYRRSFITFESFLGLKSMDDWDSFVKLSNILKLPLSDETEAGGESVQSCVFTNEDGEKMVKFAWNSFQDPKQVVSGILQSIVSDAVELATSADQNAFDDELINLTESILSRYQAQRIEGLLVRMQAHKNLNGFEILYYFRTTV